MCGHIASFLMISRSSSYHFAIKSYDLKCSKLQKMRLPKMCASTTFQAGHCAMSNDTCDEDYRGLSFGAGGDRGLDQHITIPSRVEPWFRSIFCLDIIHKYNPNVFGASHGFTGYPGWNVYNVSYLNMAISGAPSSNLPYQSNNLINTIKQHPSVYF